MVQNLLLLIVCIHISFIFSNLTNVYGCSMFIQTNGIHIQTGYDVAQAVCQRPLTLEAWVVLRGRSCAICVGQGTNGTRCGFDPRGAHVEFMLGKVPMDKLFPD
jgi:hypothetical protein